MVAGACKKAGPFEGPAPITLANSYARVTYLTILRTKSPPPTSRAPAPKPSSEALPVPPVFGSSLA